jgi:hypothetical protein
MADLSSLNGLLPAEPLDLDIYPDATVRAPESFPSTSFGATKAGFLSAQIDPTVVGPSNEGFTLKYAKVSAKPFKRGGMSVSQLGDYLRATGYPNKIGGDPQAQADAVETTANKIYTVELDWRAYNKNTGFTIKGMKNFPSDGNGGHQQYVLDPEDKDEQGNPVRVWARAEITRFVPASN